MDRLIAKGEAIGEAKLLLRYLNSRFSLPEQRRTTTRSGQASGRTSIRWPATSRLG